MPNTPTPTARRPQAAPMLGGQSPITGREPMLGGDRVVEWQFEEGTYVRNRRYGTWLRVVKVFSDGCAFLVRRDGKGEGYYYPADVGGWDVVG